MAKKKIKKKAVKPARKAAKKAPKKAAKKKSVKKTAKKSAAKKSTPKAAASRTNSINPYINFKGNCEEAFNHYREVFGGKFGYVGRFGEMPPGPDGKQVPPEYANQIMHISLPISAETTLMGCDSMPDFGGDIIMGTNFSVSVNAKSQNEADRLYAGLSQGGTPYMPMSKTFWGSYFGMCADRFGIQWMVSYDEKPAY
jgi:PhnB protein